MLDMGCTAGVVHCKVEIILDQQGQNILTNMWISARNRGISCAERRTPKEDSAISHS